jgi:lipopolysaccharide biosynthesis glycosyltransferase
MELYSKDLHSFPVAAVPDPGLSQPRPDLGISEASSYFNAGVLLINLKEWKEQKISENAIDFILQSSQGLIWGDQDALNAAAKDKWCRLDSKYNLTFFDIPPLLKKYDFPRYLEEKVIIHYTTQHKPWAKVCANRLRYLYEYYLALSPHASKKVKHHWNMKREWNAAKIRVREFIIDINMSRYLPKRVYENNQ